MTTASTAPRSAVDAAVRRIEGMGLEALYIAHGKYRVTRPGREHQPSYFTRDELIQFSALTGRVEIADALKATRRPNAYLHQSEERNDMATDETQINTTKASRKSKGPLPKPSEKKARGTSTKKATGGAKPSKAAKPSKPEKAPKQPKAEKTPAGASVKGATAGDLAYLASFQDQTIERMNGLRVVEFYVKVKNASREKPVVHKELEGIYPQRIAREMARLGIVEKEKIEGVGVAYYPKAAK